MGLVDGGEVLQVEEQDAADQEQGLARVEEGLGDDRVDEPEGHGLGGAEAVHDLLRDVDQPREAAQKEEPDAHHKERGPHVVPLVERRVEEHAAGGVAEGADEVLDDREEVPRQERAHAAEVARDDLGLGRRQTERLGLGQPDILHVRVGAVGPGPPRRPEDDGRG